MQLRGFEGRVAAVTGAAQGIGRSIADRLRLEGARVAYLDVAEFTDGSTLEADPSVLVHQCDVRDESAVDEAFTLVEDRLGDVSILVNNAGVLRSATVLDATLEDWEQSFAVNARAPFLTIRRALPSMRAAGYGRIVNLGSSAGKNGGARAVGAYAASKAAVMCLTKSVASEHAADGITANALAPALINTDMIAGLRDLADRVPVGRLGEPDDVVAATLFLASEEASYITGEVLDVNGGFLID